MDPGWREWLSRLWEQDRRLLLRLILVGIAGLGLLAWGTWGSAPGGSYTPAKTSPTSTPTLSGPLGSEETALGQQLSGIVGAIPHVGSVVVAVTLKKSAVTQYANGQSIPLDQLGPEIEGVVIVAKGATNPIIRQEVTQTVETLLQVQPYQVLVLPNGGGE